MADLEAVAFDRLNRAAVPLEQQADRRAAVPEVDVHAEPGLERLGKLVRIHRAGLVGVSVIFPADRAPAPEVGPELGVERRGHDAIPGALLVGFPAAGNPAEGTGRTEGMGHGRAGVSMLR